MPKVAHICTTRLMYKLLQDKLILLSKSGYDVDIISARDDKENNIFNENGKTLQQIIEEFLMDYYMESEYEK